MKKLIIASGILLNVLTQAQAEQSILDQLLPVSNIKKIVESYLNEYTCEHFSVVESDTNSNEQASINGKYVISKKYYVKTYMTDVSVGDAKKNALVEFKHVFDSGFNPLEVTVNIRKLLLILLKQSLDVNKIEGVAASHDGNKFALFIESKVVVFDKHRSQMVQIPINYAVKDLTFSPNHKYLAIASQSDIEVYDAEKGGDRMYKINNSIAEPREKIAKIYFCPNSSHIMVLLSYGYENRNRGILIWKNQVMELENATL